MYCDYPAATIRDEGAEPLIARTHSRRAGDRVLSSQRVSLNGHPGREFLVSRDGRLTLRSRVFLVDRRLYQVIAATRTSTPTPEVTRFLGSFRLLKR